MKNLLKTLKDAMIVEFSTTKLNLSGIFKVIILCAGSVFLIMIECIERGKNENIKSIRRNRWK